MNANTCVVTAALVACLATATHARAEAPHGFYGGGGVSLTNVTVQDDNNEDCCDYWYEYDYEYDSGEEDVGFGAHLGYRFTPYIAAELAYANAGKPQWDSDDVYIPALGGYADTEVDLEVEAVQLSALAILPFGRMWEAYVRAGASFWKADAEQTVNPLFGNTNYTRSVDDDGASFLFGIGIGVSPAPAWHFRLEYQSFPVEEELLVTDGDTTVDALRFEVQYRMVR